MRNSIQDFSLANPIYVGATVTVWTVSAGVKTATKATLYAGATGTATLANPQSLDSDGKFQQPVYVDQSVVVAVSGLSIADHDTGIINSVLAADSVADVLADLASTANGEGAALVGYETDENTVKEALDARMRYVETFGRPDSAVLYRTGTNYESAGTSSSAETRPFLHDFRPLESDGSDFNTDGVNLFIGAGAGNFTMSALAVGDVPAGTDYNLQCSHNLGIGVQALGSLTIGYKNVGIGVNAGRNVTEGHGNSMLGRDAGHDLTVGHENVMAGFTSGQLVETGDYNSLVGAQAGYNNVAGSGVVAVGRRAGFAWTAGNYNTLIGNEAGFGQTSGEYNIRIGKQAANNGITTADDCTVIGSRVTGLEDADGQVVVASGDGTVALQVNRNGTTVSKLDLTSKNTTAVDLAATDGQITAGSTLLLRSAANVGNAVTQIAAQSRTGQPWNRIVFWGGATQNTSFITNDVECMRQNSAGDTWMKVNTTPAALGVNSTMTFELTSNTELKIKVRGSDGTTRSASLTLS